MPTDAVPIITPLDDAFYSPDWRYRLAVAMSQDAGFKHSMPEAMRDPHVRAVVQLMTGGKFKTRKHDPDRLRFERAQRWGLDGPHRHTGHVIEALLLTDAPIDAIAADMGCNAEDVQLFERLFFNVRGGDGSMNLAPAQKAFFATEGTFKPTQTRPEHLMWRRVAVNAGYRALLQILEMGTGAWDKAPGTNIVDVTIGMGRAETLAKVAAGGMSMGELSRLESNRIKDKLVRHTTGELTHKDEGMELVRKIFQLLAPKMVDAQRIREAEEMRATENLRDAERAIVETEVRDRGVAAGEESLNRALRKSLEQVRRLHETEDGQPLGGSHEMPEAVSTPVLQQ